MSKSSNVQEVLNKGRNKKEQLVLLKNQAFPCYDLLNYLKKEL